ncbi:MAG: helix-turn-helix domain-containing protein [Candidatus Obscuribacterales bacterium]
MAKRKKADEEAYFTESSGNVFEDLQLPNPKALLAKTELVVEIARIIRRRRLSQAQAAKILGIDQPKVSALLSGKLTGFSLDRLLRFLALLERDIEIVVTPTRKHRTGNIGVSARPSL